MTELLLLTSATDPPAEIVPALALLLHTVRAAPAGMAALDDFPAADAVLVDARRDLARARELCQLLRDTGLAAPVIAVLTEGGLAAVTADWGTDDVILNTAGPAEVEARLRLAIGRQASQAPTTPDEIRSGDLAIDEATYSARLRSRVLDLTFKEFELLKFLAQHPGRVFTRAHLLQEVWGYDYFGGTRTVDVHVRRLRAKLGAEHEGLIGTVRNVGYRFVPVKPDEGRRGRPGQAASPEPGQETGADSEVAGAGVDSEVAGAGPREVAGAGPGVVDGAAPGEADGTGTAGTAGARLRRPHGAGELAGRTGAGPARADR